MISRMMLPDVPAVFKTSQHCYLLVSTFYDNCFLECLGQQHRGSTIWLGLIYIWTSALRVQSVQYCFDCQQDGVCILRHTTCSLRHLMRANGGCCSCVERDRKFTFKKSDVPSQHLEKLQPGAEVMFTALPDGPDNDTVVSVAVLPPGTLPAEQVSPGESHLVP